MKLPYLLAATGLVLLTQINPAARADTDAQDSAAHAAHHSVVAEGALRRALVQYQVPAVHLVREDGKPVVLDGELDDGRAVFVDFIYTTCTAICPLTSATFAALQDKLGAEGVRKVQLVSISIDPEQDTPRRLREFRAKYGAGPMWHHYTGTQEASEMAQRAFGVYTGDKMGHSAVTLFRAAPGQPWVRLDGFATPDQLIAEYRSSARSSR